MTSAPPDRQELRRRLREKIQTRRDGRCDNASGPQLAQRLKEDPQTAMLQMGIDDPSILSRAKNIVDNPQGFLRDVVASNAEEKNKEKKKRKKKKPLVNDEDAVEEEEEAPPPFPPIDDDDEEAPPPPP